MLLCGVAVLPLLRGESPCTHDGGLHYYRVVAIRNSVEQGALFSRWMPDVAFGYGFPFFNYRAPVSYYLALGLHLTGLTLPWALNLVYVLSIIGSALGAYLLGRDLFGSAAGVVAAVAYGYAPYQFLNALVRGNAPESVALALLPFVLWAFRRLALEGGRGWLAASVGLLATLYLGHNISSLLFTPLLLAYLAALWFVYRGRGHWRQAVFAFVVALGLTSFFWFPALAEGRYVQLYLTRATRNNIYYHNFLSLKEILAPPQALDLSLMNPPLEIRLGLVQLVLAGVGLVAGLTFLWLGRSRVRGGGQNAGSSPGENLRAREQSVNLLFFACATALFVFMSTPASGWLWENVPLLSFAQFPWRFVGRASLPVALLTGASLLPLTGYGSVGTGTDSRGVRWFLDLSPAVPIGLLVLATFPVTYAPTGYCPEEPYPQVEDVHRYEHATQLVGVDPEGAYFPVWVERRPTGSPLEAQYAGEGPVARFDERMLPEVAEVLAADYGHNRARIEVQSPESFRAQYLTFYFPGWRVWVNGDRVEAGPSDSEGLITFEVPAGRSEIAVRFGETTLRWAVNLASMLSLMALLVHWSWAVLRPLARKCGFGGPPGGTGPAGHRWGEADRLRSRCGESIVAKAGHTRRGRYPVLLGLTAVILLAFKVAAVDRVETPFRHPKLEDDGTLPGVDNPLGQPYADGLSLIGFDQSLAQMPADGVLRMDIHWTVRQQPSRRYQTVVHLVGPDGVRWSHSDSYRPTDYQDAPPTTVWAPGRHALDSHEVELLPGTPPGTYDIVLTVFDRESLAPLSVLNEALQPAAPELMLGQVDLIAPRSPVHGKDLDIRDRLDVKLGPVTLLGVNLDRERATPGDSIFATTFWHVEEEPDEELALRLEVLGADDSVAGTYDLPPTAARHPVSTWQVGDVWRGQHVLTLPAGLESEEYGWRLSMPPMEPVVDLPVVIRVDAPERTFVPPPVDTEVAVQFEDVASLVGASIEPELEDIGVGETLTITLVWRAESETDSSYRVFVHLVDPEGRLVAQCDGVPSEWSRPTTSWLPGEYITDVHRLTVPVDVIAGDYHLRAGLYGPDGARLVTATGGDAVSLASFVLQFAE